MNKRGVAICKYINHLDHLAPICDLLEVPLFVSTREQLHAARQLYPELTVEQVDLDLQALVPLLNQFDVVFHSSIFARSLVRKLAKKSLRVVSCPHGFSDKAVVLKHCAFEDVTLVYGDRMLEMFREEHVSEHLRDYVVTGNLRHHYYLKKKAFFDSLTAQAIFGQGKLKPDCQTILYAPTWDDMESSTSFQFACEQLIDALPRQYNLIVKLHPYIVYNMEREVAALEAKYARREGVVLVKEFPVIFPLLARSDIYIGDRSSIGYDFLAFQRPMFFLRSPSYRPRGDGKDYLLRCGTEIHPQELSRVYEIVERMLPQDAEQFARVRSEVWSHAFATRSPQDIAGDLERICANERQDDDWEIPAEFREELESEDGLLKYVRQPKS